MKISIVYGLRSIWCGVW